MSLEKELEKAADLFFNTGKSHLSDEEYDRKKGKLMKLNPDAPILKKIGAKPKKNKAKLPVYMSSLDKLRPSEAIEWMDSFKDPKVIFPKLDGQAGLLVYEYGKFKKAYTRGDGFEGQDITKHVACMDSIPKKISVQYEIVFVKIEFIVTRTVFNKYKAKFSNARQFVIGTLNSDTPIKDRLNDIRGIAYSISSMIDSVHCMQSNLEQIKTLIANKFVTVAECGTKQVFPYFHAKAPKEIWIKQTLENYKNIYDLELDGLVANRNVTKYRAEIDYSFAIKLEVHDQFSLIGDVASVKWSMSARKIYVPVVKLKEPLDFNGVKVKSITAFNAENVLALKIGEGSKLRIIRSGDVIPRIVASIKSGKVNLPKTCVACKEPLSYNNTNLFCKNPSCIGTTMPIIENFFVKLKTDLIKKGTVKALVNAGYDTIPKILSMSEKKIAAIDGFGTKKAFAIKKAISTSLAKLTLPELMVASGIFSSETTGISFSRMQIILEDVKEEKIINGKLTLKDFEDKPGIGPKLIRLYLEKQHEFVGFYMQIKKTIDFKPSKKKSGPLSGKSFVFTGWRNPDLESLITDNGGEISGSVSQKTIAVFAASQTTVKAKNAKAKGIKVYSPNLASSVINSLLKGK
jgi:DNA ligase (NAD+)